jgi:hypothetical protein
MRKAADGSLAWQELTRRADLALAEDGWTRTAVYPNCPDETSQYHH